MSLATRFRMISKAAVFAFTPENLTSDWHQMFLEMKRDLVKKAPCSMLFLTLRSCQKGTSATFFGGSSKVKSWAISISWKMNSSWTFFFFVPMNEDLPDSESRVVFLLNPSEKEAREPRLFSISFSWSMRSSYCVRISISFLHCVEVGGSLPKTSSRFRMHLS